jgi:phosphotransacetylase
MALIDKLTVKAKQKNARILLSESSDERVLKAAINISNRNIARVFLLGKKGPIEEKIKSIDSKTDHSI